MKNTTFADFNLGSETLNSITDMGFEEPTPIQQQTIPLLMEGKDLVGQAQTGTGKTAAFGIPLVERIDTNNQSVQALVMCPTRELAIQVTNELIKIGKRVDGLRITPIYGGQSISHQIKALKRGTNVVVGTPGRTIDHLKRGTLKIGGLKMVVLDEADEMLNMGFRDDIEKILSYNNGNNQMVMFSATVPKAIQGIMNRFMHNPVTIKTKKKSITAPNIDQFVVEVRDSVRIEAISRFMDINDYQLALVFCNTRRETENVSRKLKSRGYATDFLNGDMRQALRDKVMNKFRDGGLDILVATDVAARGLDVEDIDIIFNYDVPQDPEYYVHRIGRTGRAGRSGSAITFVSGRKSKQLRYIERNNKIKLEKRTLPSVEEVKDSHIQGYLTDLTNVLEKGGLKDYIEMLEANDDPRFTTIEVAAALLKMQTEKKLEAVELANAPQKNGHGGSNGSNGRSKGKGRKSNSNSGGARGMARIALSVGYKHKVGPGNILGALTGETGLSGNQVGNIDINTDQTFVDIPAEEMSQVLSKMKRARIRGQNVSVRKA